MIEEPQKDYGFKMGQMVIVVAKNHEHRGKIGTIVDLGWNGDFPIRVEFILSRDSYPSARSMRYKADELLLWNGVERARRVIDGK